MKLIKLIKSFWLESIFAVLILVVMVLSITHSINYIQIDYGKTLKRSDIQLEVNDFPDYIRTLNDLDNCTVIITAKAGPGEYVTQNMIDELKKLGFNQVDALLKNVYNSFIGIYSNGNIVYECISEDEVITFGQFLNNHYICVQSTPLSSEDIVYIYIDNIQYSANARGINIVTLDNINDELIDSVQYDAHIEDIPVYRFINDEYVFLKTTQEVIYE